MKRKKAKGEYNNEELLGEIVMEIAIKAERSSGVHICVHAAHLAPLKAMLPSFSFPFPPLFSIRLLHAPITPIFGTVKFSLKKKILKKF